MKLYTLEEDKFGVSMHINLEQLCRIWHEPTGTRATRVWPGWFLTTADTFMITLSEKDYNQILSELRTM
jgi:hypothetical protein